MTVWNDDLQERFGNLKAARFDARKARDDAKATLQNAEAQFQHFLLERWLEDIRCETVPELILLPVPKFLYKAAALQDENTDCTMNYSTPLQNVLNERMQHPDKDGDYSKTHLTSAFLLLPEERLRRVISDSWLSVPTKEKHHPPALHLLGSIPFIRKFSDGVWGVLFPQDMLGELSNIARRRYVHWLEPNKFQAVKTALELATQNPDWRNGENYILPDRAEVVRKGLPIQNLYIE